MNVDCAMLCQYIKLDNRRDVAVDFEKVTVEEASIRSVTCGMGTYLRSVHECAEDYGAGTRIPSV
jgi:hypothetical protein